ncbi:hypothetical protein HKI87_06g44640 [Chloropicon roscoffensis]|uniref:Uncharacterized protein n=1 Tax=Chloropicon roscoffensis TaxID=1461544 RepID=A0AAX4PAJ6_9CHLO
MTSSIHAISEDLRPAPNESLKENPNTLRVLKPLSRPAVRDTAPATTTTTVEEESVQNLQEQGQNPAQVRPQPLPKTTTTTTTTSTSMVAPAVPAGPPPPRVGIRRRLLDTMRKDHYLYLKQAYQFSEAVSASRLQLLQKKGMTETSGLFVPKLAGSGLGVRPKLADEASAPKHFIISPLRANNVPGPGKGISKFARVARVALLRGTQFVGNQLRLETFPAIMESRRWKFHEQNLVVRYGPELQNLKLYVEFNFEHQLSGNDRLGLGLSDRKAACQVTEGTVAWCVIPVSVCAEIKEETIVPVKLMTGSLSNPTRLDDLRAKAQGGLRRRIQETCGAGAAGQGSCYPSKQSLFTLTVKPMAYSSEDFRYLPSEFLCTMKLATVLTLHQMILRENLRRRPSFLGQELDPVLATFPKILDDEAMRQRFLELWEVETSRTEQTREKLCECFRECAMRFWPLCGMNGLGETYSNDFGTRALRSERIRQFVANKTESTLTVGGHTWSHKPFQITEIGHSLGDNVLV